MDPILEILCQGFKVCVGIFPIQNLKEQIGGRTLGLLTRVVRAELSADETAVDATEGNQSRKKMGSSSAYTIQPNQPSFILGKTNKDQEATLAEKANLLLASSDKEHKGEDNRYTVERTYPASEKEDGGCQKNQATVAQPVTRIPTTFKRSTPEIQGPTFAMPRADQTILRDFTGKNNLSQSPQFKGLGHHKRYPDFKMSLRMAQADFVPKNSQGILGSNQAQKNDIRYNNFGGLTNAKSKLNLRPMATLPCWGARSISEGPPNGPGHGRLMGNQKQKQLSATLFLNPNLSRNRFSPLQSSFVQEEGSEGFYSH